MEYVGITKMTVFWVFLSELKSKKYGYVLCNCSYVIVWIFIKNIICGAGKYLICLTWIPVRISVDTKIVLVILNFYWIKYLHSNIFMFLVFYRFNFLSMLILAYTQGELKKIVI